MRSVRMPRSLSCSVTPWAAGSDMRPPSKLWRPMCMSPLRNVPAVSTTRGAWNSAPSEVATPHRVPSPSKSRRHTFPCHMLRPGVFSSTERHMRENFSRSSCALGLHIAGPLLRLSMRNWMEQRSAIIPVIPPSASISRTICPLAIPPTAGLQLICAIFPMSMVTSSVAAPIVAAACAASQPAWPAPTTIMSKSKFIV